jgi:hypothetical protein
MVSIETSGLYATFLYKKLKSQDHIGVEEVTWVFFHGTEGDGAQLYDNSSIFCLSSPL